MRIDFETNFTCDEPVRVRLSGTHRSRIRPTVVLAILIFASLMPTVRADEIELLNQTLNGTTAIMLRVDTGKVQLAPQLADLAQQDSSGTLARLTSIISLPFEQAREQLQGEVAFFALDMPYGTRLDARLHVSTSVPEANLIAVAKLLWAGQIDAARRSAGWRTLPLCTSPDDSSAPPVSSELIPSDTEAWKAALADSNDFPVQMAVVYPKYLRDTFAEIDPELPAMLGGGSSKLLISGVRWISVGIQPESATIRIVVQTESPAIAQEVKHHIPKMLRALLKESQLDTTASTMIMALVGLLQPTVNDSQVVMALDDPQKSDALIQLAAAAVTATAKPIAASQTQNNLKQLGLALHNYYSTFHAWPTYSQLKTQEKKSGLSWRVHILPFIEQSELYNEFKLDEPWDSPHNIRLLDRMPQLFKPVIAIGSVETVKPFHTTYAAPVGESTVFGRDKAIDFQNVTDGTSNTIVVVELKTEDAIPWTSPEEYAFDPNAPAAKLRSFNGRIATLFMDGSVQGIRGDEAASVWNALFSIDGGEVVMPR